MDGWMDKKNIKKKKWMVGWIKKNKKIWMVGWMEKYKKNMDGWMDKKKEKKRWMVGWMDG